MKFFFKFRMLVALAAALIFAGTRAEAQAFGSFGLGVTSSASSLLVSNSLTYTITVSNLLGGPLSDAVVSNVLPASVLFVSAIPSFQGTYATNASGVVFDIGGFAANSIVQMTLTVQPTATGLITNLVTVSTINVTNTAAATVVVQVTNTIPPQADLGVTIAVPATPVIVNDLATYRVGVTNAGPDAAPNVFLTNTLPSGVILKSVLPTSPSYTAVSNNLIFNLGTLQSGGFTNFQFTIQPTNTGTLNCFAMVGSSGALDTNLVNNTASNSISVIAYLPGDLVVVTNSAQNINLQNGLIEQSILLSNVGTNDAPAARIVVSGLTNRLFNADGTNSGIPFVVYAHTLATNQSVTLLLQYAPRKNFPFTNSQLQAFAVPPPDLTPPVATATGTNVTITRIVLLANGNTLVEFRSVPGRSYTMVYSDNILFSNATIAPPAIVASANLVQWIDYGPPVTLSLPASGGSRFYRVFLNP